LPRTNDDSIVFDAALRYDLGALSPRFKGVDFRVNATNLFGIQYVTCKDGFCYLSEDRRVIASLRYRM
jgi:iron complex outermembrane receptor protein